MRILIFKTILFMLFYVSQINGEYYRNIYQNRSALISNDYDTGVILYNILFFFKDTDSRKNKLKEVAESFFSSKSEFTPYDKYIIQNCNLDIKLNSNRLIPAYRISSGNNISIENRICELKLTDPVDFLKRFIDASSVEERIFLFRYTLLTKHSDAGKIRNYLIEKWKSSREVTQGYEDKYFLLAEKLGLAESIGVPSDERAIMTYIFLWKFFKAIEEQDEGVIYSFCYCPDKIVRKYVYIYLTVFNKVLLNDFLVDDTYSKMNQAKESWATEITAIKEELN